MTAVPPAGVGSMAAEVPSLEIEARAAYLRVVGKGLWSPAFVDGHFGALQRQVEELRERCGSARVLVNLSGATIQPADTAERIRHWTGLIYQQRDKVAIVLASSLLKSQMRRVAIVADRELFLSEANAIAWLTA
ncbi:hypothetical protein HL653_18760 [Sphingomonas sp. AP4-R1]|uniref:hypothetical protein n=1 Tax=Sphingomonas sp. AP4-R1 TaxID=2735134 RepID=UPI001493A28D|nr:hypothetical protein [Sphingomonas sp. AP4-R1]QJU59523.1 hypothetical protein HL653_18760 [Sphingomonas sp. AP4-R1]